MNYGEHEHEHEQDQEYGAASWCRASCGLFSNPPLCRELTDVPLINDSRRGLFNARM